jgi:uncharacterized protein YajQ (UPF0234 family)
MAIVFPPVETNLLRLVDRTNHQADADRQQLDFGERHFDIARNHESLVEDAVENVDQPGTTTGTSMNIGRHAAVFARGFLTTSCGHGTSVAGAGSRKLTQYIDRRTVRTSIENYFHTNRSSTGCRASAEAALRAFTPLSHTRYHFTRMAVQPSFDITSTVDLQEVDNALNQARKEIAQRYDFKGSKASIEFDAKESKLVLVADDEFKLNALWEILVTRLVRRNVPTKNLTRGNAEPAANTTVRQEVALQQGIPSEKARDIVKFIKDAKLRKVQAAIQGDQLRITSPSKDDLQEVMRLLREQDFGVALQFGNYRG